MEQGPLMQPAPGPQGPGLRILTIVASLMVAATVTLTLLQVVLRYFFNNPQSWAEEVGRYLFVWITFLGAAIAYAHNSHIRVDLIDQFGHKWMPIVNPARHFFEAISVGVLVYSGIIVAWRHRNNMFYTMPDVPQVIFYLAVPIGSALGLFYVLRWLVRSLKRVSQEA